MGWIPEPGQGGGGGGGNAAYAETVGDGNTTSFDITHGLGSSDVAVEVIELSSGDALVHGTDYTWLILDEDEIRVVFSSAPGVDDARVVVLAAGGEGGGGGGGGAASVPWMRTPVTPPDTGWSWVNQGTATETVQDGGARVVASAATGSNNLIGRVRAHPGTPMKLTARCDLMPTATFAACGIGFRESSTGKIRVIYMRTNTTGSSPLVVESWDSPTSAPGSGVVANWNQRFTFPWLQIEDNGTNLIYRYSEYGFEGTWWTLSSEGRTAYMSGGPDEIGWFVRDNNGAVAGILSSWEVA